MDHMTHDAHGQAADPHAGHKMSETDVSHDRHAGHSVAMFRDKFWLSLALTIPVVFWSADVQHGIVTLPWGEREASAVRKFSGCCNGGPPCVHRHGPKCAVRLG